jgi:hypothetical protein
MEATDSSALFVPTYQTPYSKDDSKDHDMNKYEQLTYVCKYGIYEVQIRKTSHFKLVGF